MNKFLIAYIGIVVWLLINYLSVYFYHKMKIRLLHYQNEPLTPENRYLWSERRKYYKKEVQNVLNKR